MANRISQDFIDRLLARVDLVQIIDARVTLRKAGREFTAPCPFHAERTPSFTVSPPKQFYHCFGCGAHGNAINFLMEYEHLGFLEAVEDLARGVGLELPQGTTPEPDGHTDLITVVEQAAQFFSRQLREHPQRRAAVDYLQERGLDDEIIHTFGIGYAPPGWDNVIRHLDSKVANVRDLATAGLAIERDDGRFYDRFRDRIMFPIRSSRGRIVAFGGRALADVTPKYMNSPETPFFFKGRELYGLYEARKHERHLGCLLVVEGYMDVVALAQYGIHYAVATLGTATTGEHLDQLFRATQQLVFCFDGDRAGRTAAWRALENALPFMRDGRHIDFLFLPEGEDPDSLIRKEGQQRFEQRLDQALPLSEYFFEHLTGVVEINTIDDRARFSQQARPLLEKLPDSDFRDMMSDRLAGIAKNPLSRLNAPDRSSSHKVDPTRSPIRLAIALLLNAPRFAQHVGDTTSLRGVSVPGLSLLLELIELLQSQPHITTAALLIERYRESPTGSILGRLAQWQPTDSEEVCKTVFLDIIKQLKDQHSKERRLLEKVICGEISAEEKELLRNLQRSKNIMM